MTDVRFTTIGSTMGDEIKKFRSDAVTSENRATPMARAILAGLVAGLTSVEGVASTVIHAFGNPKSPKTGKPIAKLSGLRDFIGGDATRKTVESILTVFGNIDFDKPRDAVGDVPAVPGAAAIRPLIVSFIVSEPGAPKSLKGLLDAVKSLIDAHVAATAPASDATEEEKGEGEGEAPAPAPVQSLADRIAMLIVEVNAMDADAIEANDAALAALAQSLNDAYGRLEAAPARLAA